MRWLRRPFEFLLALLILFEEWGWEPLQAALARLGRLPPLAWIEARVAALPSYAALALFAAPTLLLVPVKLAALALIGSGRAGLGLAVIIAAKLIGTAIVARIFALTRPALMQLAWFARLHGRWVAWKSGLLDRVHAMPAWRRARALLRRTLEKLRRTP